MKCQESSAYDSHHSSGERSAANHRWSDPLARYGQGCGGLSRSPVPLLGAAAVENSRRRPAGLRRGRKKRAMIQLGSCGRSSSLRGAAAPVAISWRRPVIVRGACARLIIMPPRSW